ncbi:hypothetical protein Golob_018152, partial [Gossypium lobatum]|nr:hypothetical protein [Gossypium lobatum]
VPSATVSLCTHSYSISYLRCLSLCSHGPFNGFLLGAAVLPQLLAAFICNYLNSNVVLSPQIGVMKEGVLGNSQFLSASGWGVLQAFSSNAYATPVGVVQNTTGEWVVGFSLKVGGSLVFQVEARAFFKGLQIAWDRGFRQVQFKSDNTFLLKLFVVAAAWTTICLRCVKFITCADALGVIR